MPTTNQISPLPLVNVSSQLQERIIGFIQLLKSQNFVIGIKEEVDLFASIQHVDLKSRRQFQWHLQAWLCSSREDWQKFDELFSLYWFSSNIRSRFQASDKAPVQTKKQKHSQAEERADRQSQQPSQSGDQPGVDDDPQQLALDTGSREGASATASLARADFQSLTDPEQMQLMQRLVENLARKMRKRLVRRQKISKKAAQLDMRKTLRKNLRFGGTPINLAFKAPRKKQPHLVLFIDVSRSMSMYSFMFLRFARGLSAVFRHVTVFAFHTHLLPITQALKQTDLMRMRNSLALVSQGWSGGTKIGASLATFNQKYRSVLNRQTVSVILSDGLDTGSVETLVEQVRDIKQHSRKLVWLNPLIGRPGYEPKAQAMAATLPLLDVFAAANTLESLQALEQHFTAL
ncbi:vWA domain-containing protein [Thalassotalea mangrovi]|uniref:VWA domain-containing protein n=1 Tax=Thalassotalea mangrovi TaxID=2572245 RepID=A0A4U1B7L3_9GAMM|nr:VWA domain-containing protein [Thalassotalea mangrovi]TKB46600.1 VWA domain-containing protein [Thalassotalea mangrovi]